jgi:hypothetical protein
MYHDHVVSTVAASANGVTGPRLSERAQVGRRLFEFVILGDGNCSDVGFPEEPGAVLCVLNNENYYVV